MRNPEGLMMSLFMVADGHGPQGHHVSRFIVEVLPQLLKDLLNVAFSGGDTAFNESIDGDLTLGRQPSEYSGADSRTGSMASNTYENKSTAIMGDRWEFTKKR
jgi:serine/threonine protein phosphatase PrpC